MQIIHKVPDFVDERGEVTDIVYGIDVNSITVITCKKGSVRGNHYHKKTTQYTYVLSGKFELFIQNGGEDVQSKIIEKGDLVLSPPNEKHAFKALENSMLIACCDGPRAGKQYEEDTYRLEKPISK